MEVKASDTKEFAETILEAVWQCSCCHKIQLPKLIIEEDRNAISTADQYFVEPYNAMLCRECYKQLCFPQSSDRIATILYEFSNEEEDS